MYSAIQLYYQSVTFSDPNAKMYVGALRAHLPNKGVPGQACMYAHACTELCIIMWAGGNCDNGRGRQMSLLNVEAFSCKKPICQVAKMSTEA